MQEKYENETEERDFSNVIRGKCITLLLPEDDGCCEVAAMGQFLDCSVHYNRKYSNVDLLSITQVQRKWICGKGGIRFQETNANSRVERLDDKSRKSSIS